MLWLLLFLLFIVLCFGGVLLFGAPYLPTLTPQIKTAFELADIQPGQHMLELGCGDGKVLLAAARAGMSATGYELNPLLAIVAWGRTRRYRKNIRVVCGNFWTATWPPSEVIFTFLLDRYMKKLDTKITQEVTKPVTLVSFAFKIPDKQPSAERGGVFLYRYKKGS